MTKKKRTPPPTVAAVPVDPLNHPATDIDGNPRARLWFLKSAVGASEKEIRLAQSLERKAIGKGRNTKSWRKFEAAYHEERERQGLPRVNL